MFVKAQRGPTIEKMRGSHRDCGNGRNVTGTAHRVVTTRFADIVLVNVNLNKINLS